MPRKPKVETHRGVYQKVKGSGLWWVRWLDLQGRRRTICAGNFGTAVKLSDEKQLERRTGQVLAPSLRRGFKFSEVVALGVKYSVGRKQGDAKGFQARAELALEEFGHRAADSITTDELQKWMDEEAEEREWSAATQNRYKSSISSCFREAMRAGKVSRNPMLLVRRHTEPMGRVRYLTEDEEQRLKAAIKADLPGRIKSDGQNCLDQLDIALYAGMRKTEQFTVTLDQVDLANRFIYLSKTKNGSDRYVHLNSAATAILARILTEHARLGHPADAPLFLSKRKEPIKNPRKWFETALNQAGIEGVSWHILRHTFASRLVMNRVPLHEVFNLMGHKTLSQTLRYAHLAPDIQLEALECLVPKPGTIPVQNGSQNGSFAKSVTFQSTGEFAVNNTHEISYQRDELVAQ
ncbi:MAG TPA: site-specific integrase [Terracidiphilus sp.]